MSQAQCSVEFYAPNPSDGASYTFSRARRSRLTVDLVYTERFCTVPCPFHTQKPSSDIEALPETSVNRSVTLLKSSDQSDSQAQMLISVIEAVQGTIGTLQVSFLSSESSNGLWRFLLDDFSVRICAVLSAVEHTGSVYLQLRTGRLVLSAAVLQTPTALFYY